MTSSGCQGTSRAPPAPPDAKDGRWLNKREYYISVCINMACGPVSGCLGGEGEGAGTGFGGSLTQVAQLIALDGHPELVHPVDRTAKHRHEKLVQRLPRRPRRGQGLLEPVAEDGEVHGHVVVRAAALLERLGPLIHSDPVRAGAWTPGHPLQLQVCWLRVRIVRDRGVDVRVQRKAALHLHGYKGRIGVAGLVLIHEHHVRGEPYQKRCGDGQGALHEAVVPAVVQDPQEALLEVHGRQVLPRPGVGTR
mmetsp:Transcript_34081/g.88430  ORF Transcript_34081/g.88430 Transcript_34081/m.88430 type:complete len:250 (-) Transcript_34081:449-1198(-)